jgi:hypothetical protein
MRYTASQCWRTFILQIMSNPVNPVNRIYKIFAESY